MFTIEVVKCSDTDHKVQCLAEVEEAIRRTKHGANVRNGRKVTIRGAITDPCTCHIDALLWVVHGMRSNGWLGSEAYEQGIEDTRCRLDVGEML